MANFGYISKLEKMVSFWVVVCAVRKNNWNFYLCLNLWLTCTVWIGVPIFWQLMRSWLFPTVFRRQNVPDQKAKSHVPYTSPGDRVTSCPVARCSPVRSLHSRSRLSLLGCGRIYSRTRLLSFRILPFFSTHFLLVDHFVCVVLLQSFDQ
jgi:hypothetical protein